MTDMKHEIEEADEYTKVPSEIINAANSYNPVRELEKEISTTLTENTEIPGAVHKEKLKELGDLGMVAVKDAIAIIRGSEDGGKTVSGLASLLKSVSEIQQKLIDYATIDSYDDNTPFSMKKGKSKERNNTTNILAITSSDLLEKILSKDD